MGNGTAEIPVPRNLPDPAETPAQDTSRTSPTKPKSRASIDSLPNELLAYIFRELESPRPALGSLNDEPTLCLTDSETKYLKNVALVSKRWRREVIPLLFQYTRFLITDLQTQWHDLFGHMKPFFDFVEQHSLAQNIATFALMVQRRADSNVMSDYLPNRHSLFWESFFERIDPGELLLVVPPVALGELTSCHVYMKDTWNFDCPYHYLQLQQHSTSSSPSEATEDDAEPKPSPKEAEASSDSPGGIPDSPAPEAEVEQQLAAEPLDFDVNPVADVLQGMLEPPYSSSSTLFSIRPWTSLLLNEGSFIKAYSTHEYWNRQAPSILRNLIGDPNHSIPALIPPTVHNLSYIAIFPTAPHFTHFTTNIPRLTSLYIQLVPRNNLHRSPAKMIQVDEMDLWMERNSCYALIVREIVMFPLKGSLEGLREFESGDCQDKEAWAMAVEYVKRAIEAWPVGERWVVKTEGLFVREARQADDNDEKDENDKTSARTITTSWKELL